MTDFIHEINAGITWRRFGKLFGWGLSGWSGDHSAFFYDTTYSSPPWTRRNIFEVTKQMRLDIEAVTMVSKEELEQL